MKKLLVLITLFASFTANASGIRFSNGVTFEYGFGTSQNIKGGGYEVYYTDSKVTYNGIEYPSVYITEGVWLFFPDGSNYLSQTPGSSPIAFSFIDFQFGGNEDKFWSIHGEKTEIDSFSLSDMDFEFNTYDKASSELISTENITLAQASETPVAETPIPGAIWLFGAGIIGLFKLTKRQEELIQR